MSTKVIFITGTDTGVGKTLLTALLIQHLRSSGAGALALKPFCSGGREDAQLLHDLQNGDLTLDEINPFYFPEPVAPLISARMHRRQIRLDRVVDHIRIVATRVSRLAQNRPSRSVSQNVNLESRKYLLIEGSGGLLVPLGAGYTVRDLISRLNCSVIVVARNKLGTINHTLLTVQSLAAALGTANSTLKVVLMDSARPDPSCASNPTLLRELLSPIPVIRFAFLGPRSTSLRSIEKNALGFTRTLAHVLS